MNEEIDNTYSPTPTAESVRLCLTLAILCDWIIKFTDVSTAFLHAEVIGTPYVFAPETENLDHTTKVWKLNKALYGLKSAPRAWNAHITKVLIDLDWVKSDLDECVFFKKKTCSKKQVTSLKNFPLSGIVIVYVDDLIVAGEEQIVQNFYTEFKKECIIS